MTPWKTREPSGSGWYDLQEHDDAGPIRVWLFDCAEICGDIKGFTWGWNPTDDPEAVETSWDLESLEWRKV